MDNNLVTEALTLTMYGMGFVFVFLALMVVVTTLMSASVLRLQPNAILESHPCLIITTASIKEPMIKNTASFINAFAIPSAESIPPYI